MAPEQIRGEHVDARTDVYALGALAFHLLTGRRPFEDASMTMSQYMHLHAARPRASASAPVSGPIDEIVVRAMAIDPALRQPDALALFAALRGAVSEAASASVATTQAFGVLVAVAGPEDGDDAALDDVDRALDLAERVLLGRGFAFARDLGEAVLFVRDGDDAAAAQAAVVAAADELGARPGADARVRVRLVLHRAALVSADGRPVGGPVCDPAGWGLPDAEEGVWIGGGGGFTRVA
jgi:serine/threonine-protein kinase